MILGLAKLAKFRDTDTGQHLERISSLAVRLAEEASHLPEYSGYINKDYLSDLAISSLLHDIGKVGIPDNILLKPGKLTQEEYETMKIHSSYGSTVIEEFSNKMGDTDFLIMAAHIAKYHHEKWDGSGYPEGLSGPSIPLAARIVALVDAYDALISERVYKQSISHEKALEVIRAGTGIHFDPQLTKLFIAIFE